MRLIDADALHKAYMELRNFKQDPQSGDWISLKAVPLTTVIRMLNDAPSIDIVRCGECKYAHMTYGGECKYCDIWSLEDPLYLDGDFFCSCGERKSDE